MSTERIFSSEETGLEEILTSYFNEGFTYIEIFKCAPWAPNYPIYIKKKIKALGLHRRPLFPWRATIE